MTEQQAQGTDTAQNPQDTQSHAEGSQESVEGRGGRSPYQYTNEDVGRIAKKERTEAAQAKEREISESLGVSLDEAKNLISEARQRQESEKDALTRLQERDEAIKATKDEAKQHRERAERFEAIVKTSVDSQMEALPDDIKDLLSNFDAAGQFEWLTKHGQKYREGQEPEAQPRRAPDANRTAPQGNGNRSDESFMDLLRAKGLGGG